MNSRSDEGVGGFIRSYADRMRADALEKAAELTGAAPPPWATGKPSPSRPLDMLPSPAPPAPPSPEPGAPMPAPPLSLDVPADPTTVDTTAEIEGDDEVRSEPGPPESDPSMALVSSDETTVEGEGTGEIVVAVDDAVTAWLPPPPEIDPSLSDTTVAELEKLVDDTRAELRQWKRELRHSRRDLRRQRRYERRFGPE